MLHGQECQYPVDLFYAKPHDELMMKDGFAEWLDEQFRDAHSSAQENYSGQTSVDKKAITGRKFMGEPYAIGDKVWVWSQEAIKSKKSFDLWEGPYVGMARLSEVRYKLSKVSNPSKVKFLHFDMLKHFAEETFQPEKSFARKRPTPYRSAYFSDDPEMHVEDEAFWANNSEGFNHDPGPSQELFEKKSHEEIG